MKRISKQIKILFISCFLPLLLSACAQNVPAPDNISDTQTDSANSEAAADVNTEESVVNSGEEDSEDNNVCYVSSSRNGRNHWWGSGKYTQEDYDLVVSFNKEGYQDQTVEEFNKSVMDWEDEEAYHKMEETLMRLYSSLSKEDKNAGFIFGTLSNTWDSCENKHYETCSRQKNLWHSGYSEYLTFGDVYGDQVQLTGAYADFDFDYQIADEKSITVGQRDTLLKSVEESLSEYMSGQTKEKLRDEDAMKKTLKGELENILKAFGDNNLTWSGSCDLYYWWDAPWETEWYYDKDDDNNEYEEEKKLTEKDIQKQYDYVMEKLQFNKHQDMTVAEFDRMVNSLFMAQGEEEKKVLKAYEIVTCYLDENDPNLSFFHNTIPKALEEYDARARTVYSGKDYDPEFYDYLYLEHKEDVFGDQIVVGNLNAEYILTYRILDADTLTVGQRDLFFEQIKTIAGKALKEIMIDEKIEESTVKKALMEAGKQAGGSAITLVDCQVEYVECYNYD